MSKNTKNKPMNSIFYDVEGTSMWANIKPEQRDFNQEFGFDVYDGRYSINVKVSDVEVAKLLELQDTERLVKRDPKTGEATVKLTRKHSKVYKDGTRTEKGPPKVYDQEGNELDINTLPDIGNGTPVRVRMNAYEYKPKLWSHQILGVQIDMNNLVKFEGNSGEGKQPMMSSWKPTTQQSVDNEETI